MTAANSVFAQAKEANHPLLQVRGIKKYFPVTEGIMRQKITANVKAVDGVSFDIMSGETLGLVGESGCGKTTTGRCILMLEQLTEGQIFFDGVDVATLDQKGRIALRQKIQVIFQDPFSSLNPRQKVGEIISEAPRIHGLWPSSELDTRLNEIMERVGLDPEFKHRYPHQFSGGQRQRIGIARALAVGPEFIVCDEAVSALDVTIQAQILELLSKLQRERGLTLIFITHDLGLVAEICDHIAVLYMGKIVEEGNPNSIFHSTRHPYTKGLLACRPPLNKRLYWLPIPILKVRLPPCTFTD